MEGRQKKEEVGERRVVRDGRSSLQWKELRVKDTQAGVGEGLNPCLSWDVLFIASVTLA